MDSVLTGVKGLKNFCFQTIILIGVPDSSKGEPNTDLPRMHQPKIRTIINSTYRRRYVTSFYRTLLIAVLLVVMGLSCYKNRLQSLLSLLS